MVREPRASYKNAPEFFNGVEGDDFFEEVIPIIALGMELVRLIPLEDEENRPCRWAAL